MTNYMKKTLLILFTAVLLGAPVSSYAFMEQGGFEQSVSNIKIEIKNKQVREREENRNLQSDRSKHFHYPDRKQRCKPVSQSAKGLLYLKDRKSSKKDFRIIKLPCFPSRLNFMTQVFLCLIHYLCTISNIIKGEN